MNSTAASYNFKQKQNSQGNLTQLYNLSTMDSVRVTENSIFFDNKNRDIQNNFSYNNEMKIQKNFNSSRTVKQKGQQLNLYQQEGFLKQVEKYFDKKSVKKQKTEGNTFYDKNKKNVMTMDKFEIEQKNKHQKILAQIQSPQNNQKGEKVVKKIKSVSPRQNCQYFEISKNFYGVTKTNSKINQQQNKGGQENQQKISAQKQTQNQSQIQIQNQNKEENEQQVLPQNQQYMDQVQQQNYKRLQLKLRQQELHELGQKIDKTILKKPFNKQYLIAIKYEAFRLNVANTIGGQRTYETFCQESLEGIKKLLQECQDGLICYKKIQNIDDVFINMAIIAQETKIQLLRYAWMIGNQNLELNTYDFIGLTYYHEGNVKLAEYYHIKMIQGDIEKDEKFKELSTFQIKNRQFNNNPLKKYQKLKKQQSQKDYNMDNDLVSSSDDEFELTVPQHNNLKNSNQVELDEIFKQINKKENYEEKNPYIKTRWEEKIVQVKLNKFRLKNKDLNQKSRKYIQNYNNTNSTKTRMDQLQNYKKFLSEPSILKFQETLNTENSDIQNQDYDKNKDKQKYQQQQEQQEQLDGPKQKLMQKLDEILISHQSPNRRLQVYMENVDPQLSKQKNTYQFLDNFIPINDQRTIVQVIQKFKKFKVKLYKTLELLAQIVDQNQNQKQKENSNFIKTQGFQKFQSAKQKVLIGNKIQRYTQK